MLTRDYATQLKEALNWSKLSAEAKVLAEQHFRAMEVWDDRPAEGFVARLPKPPRHRNGKSVSGSDDLRVELINAYVISLKDTYGDHRLSGEVIERARRDTRLRKKELDAILKGLGIVSASNKPVAFSHLLAWSSQGERDRIAEMRIKQGA